MNNIEKTIYELELSLLKPEVRSSTDKLNELLADDFMEFGSSGAIYYKPDTLQNLTASTDKVAYAMSDFKAKELSEAFVLTTFKTERIINNTDITVSLRSSIWKKNKGSWQMFFHQGTLIKN